MRANARERGHWRSLVVKTQRWSHLRCPVSFFDFQEKVAGGKETLARGVRAVLGRRAPDWRFPSAKGIRTLVRDLKDRPQHLVLLLALVRGVLGVFHFVAELEQRVFDVVETLGRRLAVFRSAEGRHRCGGCAPCGGVWSGVRGEDRDEMRRSTQLRSNVQTSQKPKHVTSAVVALLPEIAC